VTAFIIVILVILAMALIALNEEHRRDGE